MVDAVIAAFPLVAGLLAAAVLLLAVRFDRKLARGPSSAGPREPEQPPPPGQTRTPWELQAIEDQLRLLRTQGHRAVPRYDLNATVNRLIVAARLDDPEDQLPITADEDDVEAAIARVEAQLGLERGAAT